MTIYTIEQQEAVEEALEVLRLQGIALDTQLENWTFHDPFGSVRKHFGLID